jgi:predicted DCC family thiol-disulfide oxidoreductase YuxK
MILVSITFPTELDRRGTLLYDDDCGICVATASWLADRVAPERLGLLGLHQAGNDPELERLVQGRRLMATLHFVRSDETILTGARAVLAAGRLVPRWRFVAILFDNRLGHLILEPIYRQIALSRRRIGRLLGLPAACALPPRARGTGSLVRDEDTHA